jgi:hypothetical protein
VGSVEAAYVVAERFGRHVRAVTGRRTAAEITAADGDGR